MLIEFTVGNFLSFKERKTLSMEATAIKENPENVIELNKHRLLRSAVIYGANSSGKSNFLKAMYRMRDVIISSAKNNSTSEIDVQPFLLSTITEKLPSYFEILILVEGIRYRYGFEVDKNSIHAEWLFESKSNTEKPLFYRDKDSIEVTNDFEEGRGIEEKTRDNALFLSVVDQFNGSISKKIMAWFDNQTNISGLHHENAKDMTFLILESERFNIWLKDFINTFDLGFRDFELKDKKIITIHNKYDEEGNISDKYEFDLSKQESAGTNKISDMAGYIMYGLKFGALTVIDELDAKLHPLLTMAIVKLFNSPDFNTENAQLIFATHDTNLLNYGCFRRDQIYFTEKDKLESSDMYSLVEYKEPDGTKVRKDRSFEKDYIAGRYGAIPFIGDFSKLIRNGKNSENR